MATPYDLAIIGGGPAGVAAGVYAARKQLRTVFITEDWGGQSNVSPEIQNWIGTVSLSGTELANNLEEHVKAYAGDVVDIREGTRATEVTQAADSTFSVTTKDGDVHTARTVLICAGAHRRKLDVPGAAEFENKGVVYCASCDGPLFSDMDVAVVGGGNAGFESAAQLLAYAKSVTLLHRREEFKADEITVEKVMQHPNFTALTNTEPTEVLGEQFVSGLKYTNLKTGEDGQLDVNGVFVEIGLVPNTDLVRGLVAIDDIGRIETDPVNNRASVPGVWAAGDCTTNLYHQNNIAAGDAVRALEDIYTYL